MKFLFLSMTALLFVSCASRSPQTDKLLKSRGDIPRKSNVKNVPFVEQSDNFCGPASLAMMLNFAGKTIKMNELAPQMYTPGKNGTFQTDIISSARSQGMMAIPIYGVENLLKEISANHPVLILQNLGLSFAPIWHYAVVTGYDLKEATLRIHSGKEKNKTEKLKFFEESWDLADHWGLLVLKPTELSVTADDLTMSTSAAGLEQAGKMNEAEQAYVTILTRFPDSLGSLIGMGNIRFNQKNYKQSASYLKHATIKHPDSSIAWHNLTFAQGAAGQKKEAKLSAHKAMSLVSPQEAETYRLSLKEWLK